MESRSFPLIRYTSSEAEIIVPLASNSRQSLSLVCDSFVLDTRLRTEKSNDDTCEFILLHRDRNGVVVFKDFDHGSTFNNDERKYAQDDVDGEDVSTKEHSHHHHHHRRRRSSFNLDEFEDVDSDFEEDEHDGFESVDDEENLREVQDNEITRKIVLTCAQIAKRAARDANLASQHADRAIDTLLGRERIMYDAEVYVFCVHTCFSFNSTYLTMFTDQTPAYRRLRFKTFFENLFKHIHMLTTRL